MSDSDIMSLKFSCSGYDLSVWYFSRWSHEDPMRLSIFFDVYQAGEFCYVLSADIRLPDYLVRCTRDDVVSCFSSWFRRYLDGKVTEEYYY